MSDGEDAASDQHSDADTVIDKEDTAQWAEDDSDGDRSTVDGSLESKLPKMFWIDWENPEDPVLTLWDRDPDLEQIMFPDSTFDQWQKEYPTIYGLLAAGGVQDERKQVAKAKAMKAKAGNKEVPRPVATTDPLFWQAMSKRRSVR